jgi:ATP-dependent DNA helicase
MDKQILEEEEKARRQNEAAEKRHLAAKARRKRKVPLSSAERAAKARELEELMERSERFGQELRAGSHVLGRVGSGMDGSTLGGQDIEMAEQPGLVVHGTMRPYQLEGLTWMFELASKGLSGILADEMGLG